MGVLTLGLLGVAAIFPVGGANVQRGEITIRADAVAQAALNDAITRGLLDPERWVAYEDTTQGAGARGWPEAIYTPFGRSGTYSRPYAADYRRRLEIAAQQAVSGNPLWTPVIAANRLNSVLGSVVVIDPSAVAAQTSTIGGADFDATQQLPAFPSSVDFSSGILTGTEFNVQAGSTFQGGRWNPWQNDPNVGWPLQRVTVARTNTSGQSAATPVTFAEADRMVTSDDDLALELPEEEDQPSQTSFLSSGSQPLLRQARQEYSYLLTVVPTTLDAHRALANGGDGAYDVSSVVMNRRVLGARGNNPPFSSTTPPDLVAATQRLEALQQGERLVRVSIQSPGPGASGGEVLFFRGDTPNIAPFGKTENQSGAGGADSWWEDWLGNISPPWDDLRTGQWVFLFGPHPVSTNVRPQIFAQWYRVLSIDDTEAENGEKARLRVQLRGPDWPWTNTDNINNEFNPTATEGHLFAVIVPDVVAVHTRTLNLRSGADFGQ